MGVDSAVGHVAAATGTPAVLICAGMSNEAQRRLLSGECRVLRHPALCAPCYRSRGCLSMACARGVEASEVLEACPRILDGDGLGRISRRFMGQADALNDQV